ncbi:hypothetical protein ACI65C_004229 [Semiaphis heraclei]
MIASETRNHCAAVVMDLSTRASSGGGGDSNDGGNHGRRRSGGGRPAKSVFSIRSLVGEDTVRSHRDDRDVDGSGDDDNRDDHVANATVVTPGAGLKEGLAKHFPWISCIFNNNYILRSRLKKLPLTSLHLKVGSDDA